ncbi:hypothetical protein [Coleofasciculus sp. C1-SOL-03]
METRAGGFGLCSCGFNRPLLCDHWDYRLIEDIFGDAIALVLPTTNQLNG